MSDEKRKLKLLDRIKRSWKESKEELYNKAIEKAINMSNLKIAIEETKKITPTLCFRCKRHVQRIVMLESDKMAHFKSFDWCSGCKPKIEKLFPLYDDNTSKVITKAFK